MKPENRTFGEMKIFDDTGKELPAGEEGHIALRLSGTRPPALLKEYWKDPEEMEKSFHDGHYFTGDRGYMDDERDRKPERPKTPGAGPGPRAAERATGREPVPPAARSAAERSSAP